MLAAGITPVELLRTRRLIVCVGTGGVGKTTVAAALAVRAAQEGRNVLVITIDPARRLADALGVSDLDNDPRGIDAEILAELGVRAEGSLSAMMIDMKRTFDDLVERISDSPEMRKRILENQIYQHLSDTLAGSAEYAAMAKVYEMSERPEFDLVVVDTPPSQHALDFLEAPQRLMEFLDSRVVKALVNPALAAGRFGFKLFHRATVRVVALMERVTGLTFLEDISEFLTIFAGMSDSFQARAREVRTLLTGPESSFVLVAGATPEAAANGESFLANLTTSDVPLAGIVINRMRLWPRGPLDGPFSSDPPDLTDGPGLEADLAALAQALESEDAARGALQVARRHASVVRQDLESTAALEASAQHDRLFYCRIPELPRDVHDLTGLVQLGRHLFEDWGPEGSVERSAAAPD